MIILKADYKKYNVSELEKLRMDEEKFYETFDNAILLQTCNRVEIIFDADSLEEIKGIENIDLEKFDILFGDKAIEHLFRVACGLESMIVGEDQILGQLKNAYLKAKEKGRISKKLEKIILKAIHTGQRARVETKINEGGVSIGSAAVELAEKIFGLEGKNVLLIGAGEMANLVIKALKEKNIKAIIVANRTYEKAEKLAKELGGMAIKFDKLEEALRYADIVISATGAPHPILNKERLKNAGKTIIIDIANPRDTTDDIRELPDIFLFTIDDLRLVAEENLKKRKEEIPKVEMIICEELERLKEFLDKMRFETAIKELGQYIENVRKKEVEKAKKILKNKNKPVEEVLEDFSKALCKRIIYDIIKIFENVEDKEVFECLAKEFKKLGNKNKN
ncbi:glutamyl-tRNA reductase (hemA) [Methanocaldococcus jannaschii DSM 2661]|uniref:Glutamyl-tRNA reductase n=1 Tax=Methanocaldococcus jannaschii (strain ATCC 43067 / DSM 2661 / JAL-1 / JCM 10045 / NBRC 100440) TaxID=243232 RepID=HEM1_METJA|nr:glutamyl-tRNA reductase [Methanocaldococcus jannaschii]Q60172.1 RecName: Full=Glutamyl-tRNA reductase; Short=GluTR [Methanocaldococcus jannaschii DSM 2661]AAB98126.1 glutamyl-tRNA reductase (hemA) [Methanocaldococcus jannaschii DSM 2661]